MQVCFLEDILYKLMILPEIKSLFPHPCSRHWCRLSDSQITTILGVGRHLHCYHRHSVSSREQNRHSQWTNGHNHVATSFYPKERGGQTDPAPRSWRQICSSTHLCVFPLCAIHSLSSFQCSNTMFNVSPFLVITSIYFILQAPIYSFRHCHFSHGLRWAQVDTNKGLVSVRGPRSIRTVFIGSAANLLNSIKHAVLNYQDNSARTFCLNYHYIKGKQL